MTTATKAVELKEGANKVEVVGTLVEKNLEYGEYTKQVDGQSVKVENISGTISVRVSDTEVHTVRLRSNKFTNAGKENSLYKGYETIKNEYVSVADAADNPELNPTQVRVDGKLTTNEYYGQDGKLRQFQQIEGKFVNRLTEKDDPTPRATFEVDVYIDGVKPEMENEEETGRALVSTWIPTFNAIIPYKFAVIEQGSSFFQDDIEKRQTIKVYGQLVNKKVEHVKMIEAAFGDPIEEKTYEYTNEALIQNAAMPYDEESVKAFNPEAVTSRLAAREIYLENQKNKAGQPQQQKSSAPTGVGSFGSSAPAPKQDAGVKGVDLTNMF